MWASLLPWLVAAICILTYTFPGSGWSSWPPLAPYCTFETLTVTPLSTAHGCWQAGAAGLDALLDDVVDPPPPPLVATTAMMTINATAPSAETQPMLNFLPAPPCFFFG